MTHHSPQLPRRRFLTISAAAAGLCAGGPTHATPLVHRWAGRALGAPARMTLTGVEAGQAASLSRAVEAELERLEAVFSLYRSTSELSRLNAQGELARPSPELIEVLSRCSGLVAATDGAFDPTVQPLWQIYAAAQSKGGRPQQAAVQKARSLIGWGDVRVDPHRVEFARKGMALTLNGIAQGYVTDQIAALLRRRGMRNVLIDMGEVAAIGQSPDRSHWNVGVATPQGNITAHVQLTDRALAVSASDGMALNTAAGMGHILDPRLKAGAPDVRLVAISAASAALADGLSTAGCLMTRSALDTAVRQFPETRIEVFV